MYVNIYIYIYIHTCVYIYIYIYIHTHLSIYLSIYLSIRGRVGLDSIGSSEDPLGNANENPRGIRPNNTLSHAVAAIPLGTTY